MSFFRTILGDVPVDEMGVCYAHEHLFIDSPWIREHYPDFVLDSLERAIEELRTVMKAGVQTMVDSMPGGAGRRPDLMIALAQATGMHLIVPTGLHLAQYYPPSFGYGDRSEEELVGWFVHEIEMGLSPHPSLSPNSGEREKLPPPQLVRIGEGGWGGEATRAGLIKVAGSRDRLSSAERRNFRAAAAAHCQTGCPILTHTEQGTAAMEQIEILCGNGVPPEHIVLSHLDRNLDLQDHRDALRAGVTLEYDSHFRWKTEDNPTTRAILELAPEFPNQIVLGMDAARSAYWRSYGGEPGLDWLIMRYAPELRVRGLEAQLLENILIANPARAYAFASTQGTHE